MRRRPVQDIRVWTILDRTARPNSRRPYMVRWVIDGERFTRSHGTRAEADRYRSRLVVAKQDGERFDLRTGEPTSWAPAADEMPLYVWARTWVDQEWADWAPRSRASILESLARFVPLVCDPKAPDPPTGLRRHIRLTLVPGAEVEPQDECERWLGRWGLTLAELSKDLLADVERQLGVGDAGQPLASATAGRHRKNAHTCIRRAVELGRLEVNPWPPAPTGRSRRKARRKRRAVDIRRLPDRATMVAIIKAIRTHQPGSRNYQLMTAVMYYAGLRPSEVVMLRPRALHLPPDGWGWIDVIEADIDWDEPGEPKTGERRVPIPPELVAWLRKWIVERSLGQADLLFRTRNDRRPTPSNWGRALKRACTKVGRAPIRVYDARHACATSWLRAGVPLGEVARRLGHSVETLVAVYVGALDGDDTAANKLIDIADGDGRLWMGSA